MSLDTLARHLHASKEALIDQWENHIARETEAFPKARELPQPMLRNELSHLLDQIGLALSDPPMPRVEPEWRAHRRQRQQVGHDIGEMLRELSILRELLMTFVSDFIVLGKQLSPDEQREARRRIQSTIDRSIQAAVNQFHADTLAERQRTEEAWQRQNERLKLLSEAAGHLLSTDDPERMVRGLFDQVSDQLGLAAYFNFMVNEVGDALRLDSCAGIPAEAAREIEHLEFGQAVCGRVAQQRQAIVASDIQTSEDPKVQLVKRLGLRAYACNPLLVEDRLLGTLSFATRNRDQFDEEELEFLQTICHYVAMAKERQRLTAQVIERAERLAQADRRKDEFLAMLAHELRNPLGAINNALEVMRRGDPGGSAFQRAMTVVERQLQHQVRIVDDLLDVSRITRGKIALARERVDLAWLLDRTIEDYRSAVETAGLSLELSLPAESVWVTADPTRVAQVMGNLLANATKFTEPGGQIIVRLTTSADPAQAVISVRDTGIGIAPEMLPHVCESFTQADHSLDRRRGGLGLGLALVKGLIELHGGEVRAESAGLGCGAEFLLTLPLPSLTERHGEASHPAVPSVRRQRILVIEDNRDAAETLRDVLELSGHQVQIAFSGPAGVATARQFQPEIVLCDIGLPGMDGYEVARLLRQSSPPASTRLIALSGYGQVADRQQSLKAGFEAHVTKPVHFSFLLQLLDARPESQHQEAVR